MKVKGKNTFTSNEISKIEKLIELKLQSSNQEQKSIRQKIRNIGFYWEDFYEKGKVKYNIENFRKLISYGSITVSPTITNKVHIATTKHNTENNQITPINKDYKQGLEPWVGKNPKVLILGSMPGDESIRQQTYYANISHNSFWKIMYYLFTEKRNQDNKEFITSHNIALWDCVHSGIRTGSTDDGFNDKAVIPNDLELFLNQHPTIKTIILNGKGKPMKYYKKYFSHINACHVIALDSTSNTCSKTFDYKKQEWSIIKDLVEDEQ